ncbi:hypothetical protein FRX31_015868 [Thalictrum thalictroides]|uniref:Uncharacterized protein n=1 Tax=Thalictrum thalictroides TaxID=46969 RepID=A0A7J6WD86_THATH|nr:hypothetical protein FRX31_015868 [Thalictrum thalictroides]
MYVLSRKYDVLVLTYIVHLDNSIPHVYAIINSNFDERRKRIQPSHCQLPWQLLLKTFPILRCFYCLVVDHCFYEVPDALGNWNDLIDVNIDKKMERTKLRPIASDLVTPFQGRMFLASSRLGVTINWGALLGWAAVNGSLDPAIVLPYIVLEYFGHSCMIQFIHIRIKKMTSKWGLSLQPLDLGIKQRFGPVVFGLHVLAAFSSVDIMRGLFGKENLSSQKLRNWCNLC